MRVSSNNPIKHLLTFEPDVLHDYRGENCETFNADEFKLNCKRFGVPEMDMLVDSFSVSKKNVLRGFHGDTKTWKLVQCIQGDIQLVVIDTREDSPTQHKTATFYLNDRNRMQVLIPVGCVNAHLVLSDTCIFGYKLSYTYVPPQFQMHVKWNDPQYNIFWPINNPILSQRDSQ